MKACVEGAVMVNSVRLGQLGAVRVTLLSGPVWAVAGLQARGVSGLQEVDAAAKTGTADYTTNLANATFTACSPFSDPRVAVTVFVEPGPSEQGGLVGSIDAGPVAADVLAAALG